MQTDVPRQKAAGVHYTPADLAAFVAENTATSLSTAVAVASRPLRVLDPACGDGVLLAAIAEALHRRGLAFELYGCDDDPDALSAARARLGPDATLTRCDFLAWVATGPPRFDVVIANPPYVRTQVLGGAAARRLAADFGLRGRVDLYQAFVAGITAILAEGGHLGLIASNRFLTVRSGASVRGLLAARYDVRRIVDLGDTRLFRAAVLPALVFATRTDTPAAAPFPLSGVYREPAPAGREVREAGSLLAELRAPVPGFCRVAGETYRVTSGEVTAVPERPWTAGDAAGWVRLAEERAYARFGEVAPIRVGVKTTADAVFVRDDWAGLGPECPEPELLLPLLTHRTARRWRCAEPAARILYPYDLSAARRAPVDLAAFPLARAYLEKHRARLEARRYVLAGGRQWWEIWVPQRPAEWAAPKLVFPDISERPCAALDDSGAVVNGDCYWIPLSGVPADLAALMLAVANSTFATAYYDARCGNRLYGARRRFITQYVSEFPLPDPAGKAARRAIGLVRAGAPDDAELDALVWDAFGVRPPS